MFSPSPPKILLFVPILSLDKNTGTKQRAAARGVYVYAQVAMRCRPYSIDDKLGVQMVQNGEEEGEVNLLNSDYTTNRFAFTYAWWSAYGFDRHIQSNHVSHQEQSHAWQRRDARTRLSGFSSRDVVESASALSYRQLKGIAMGIQRIHDTCCHKSCRAQEKEATTRLELQTRPRSLLSLLTQFVLARKPTPSQFSTRSFSAGPHHATMRLLRLTSYSAIT